MLDNWVNIIGLQLHSIYRGTLFKSFKISTSYLQNKEWCGGFKGAKTIPVLTIVQYHGLQLHSKEG